MHDGCPHRLVPLSMGMIEGDNIRCKSHGRLFDGEGRCLQAPGKDASLGPRVSTVYETAERYGMTWVWIGAEAAALAKLPDRPWLAGAAWARTRATFPPPSDHLCALTNLMTPTP